jgi:hypothetical protein
MARGRKTGGRQKGSRNKVMKAREAEIAASGQTPLEAMLDNMRFCHEAAAAILRKLIARETPLPDDFSEFSQLLKFRQIAQDAAKDAAPYCHPRLTSVEHKGEDGGPIQTVLKVVFVKPPNASS